MRNVCACSVKFGWFCIHIGTKWLAESRPCRQQALCFLLSGMRTRKQHLLIRLGNCMRLLWFAVTCFGDLMMMMMCTTHKSWHAQRHTHDTLHHLCACHEDYSHQYIQAHNMSQNAWSVTEKYVSPWTGACINMQRVMHMHVIKLMNSQI